MKNKTSKEDILKIISKILKMSPQKIEKIDNVKKISGSNIFKLFIILI